MIHSQEIKKSIKILDDSLPNFVHRLDQISNDIKELEKILQSKNIPIGVCVGVAKWVPLTANEKEKINNSEYRGKKIVPQEWIAWDRCNKSGKMRLLHQRVFTFEGKPISSKPGPLEKIKSKPLIESSVEERLRSYERLPRLVTSISSVLLGESVSLF